MFSVALQTQELSLKCKCNWATKTFEVYVWSLRWIGYYKKNREITLCLSRCKGKWIWDTPHLPIAADSKGMHKPDTWQYYEWCQRDKQDCGRMKCKADIPCPHIRRPVAQSGQESRIAREGRKAKWDAIFTDTTILQSGWACKNGKQNRCAGTDTGINKPVKTETIWAKCGINNWVANTHVVTFEQLVLECPCEPIKPKKWNPTAEVARQWQNT